jgi:hypothetical protein
MVLVRALYCAAATEPTYRQEALLLAEVNCIVLR